MVEFCFETVNWSPYFGVEQPDVRAMIRAAANHGFRWMSLDLPTIDYFVKHDGSLADLGNDLKQHDVSLLAVHSLAIGRDVDAVARLTEAALNIGSALDARYLHAGVTAEADANVVSATRRAGTMCRERGLGFAVEFLPFLPVASIEQTRSLLAAAGIGGRNLVVDSWHFFHGPDDWPQLEALSADEIAYVQFDDHPPLASNNLFLETTQSRVMPGQGTFDLVRFANTLQSLGYDGVVGPEILSAETRNRSMDSVAQEIMTTTKPYWT